MCAGFEFRKHAFKPGKEVVAMAETGVARFVWAGFARAEILDGSVKAAFYWIFMPIDLLNAPIKVEN